jgi:signal transduction histidine kinase
VNVAVSVMADRLQNSKAIGINRLANLLSEHSDNLADFIAHDPRGRQVPSYVQQLAEHLSEERADILKELSGLVRNVDHIKEIVSTQQNYAKVLGLTEVVALSELLEDALKIHCGAFERHGVSLVRDYQPVPDISVDKHKLLQILVNLLSNAKYACEAANVVESLVVVRLKPAAEGRVQIEVADNGVGIARENLTRIFSHGFTTRKGGHGFGLHSAALAAGEMGGSISVSSDGAGKGATFTVELPVTAPKSDAGPGGSPT